MSGARTGEHRQTANKSVFFRRWLANPLQMGSVIPSSATFSRLIAERVHFGADEVVVELGAGTGTITRALLHAGVPAEKLVVVEIVPEMAQHLRQIFPGVQVICGDGFELPRVLEQAGAGRVGDVVCGIPLVMLPFPTQQKVVGAMLAASPVRGFLHLSYCITSPLPSAKLGLSGNRLAWTMRNFPPGGVWRYAPLQPAPQRGD